MGYLDNLPKDSCPFCLRALSDYVSSESYVGRYITVDVPADILVGEATVLKEKLYKTLKRLNQTAKGRVRFNIESLK